MRWVVVGTVIAENCVSARNVIFLHPTIHNLWYRTVIYAGCIVKWDHWKEIIAVDFSGVAFVMGNAGLGVIGNPIIVIPEAILFHTNPILGWEQQLKGVIVVVRCLVRSIPYIERAWELPTATIN